LVLNCHSKWWLETFKLYKMKKYILYPILTLLVSVFTFTACDKWIDPAINIDPDVPSEVPVELLMPSMELALAYHIGGNRAVKTTAIFMQQINGVARNSNSEANYSLASTDTDDLWRRMYYQGMMDAVTIIDLGYELNSPHYSGAAKVCLAMSLGTLTNLFGDIPYSEAFLGSDGVLTPAYDSQQDIYTAIDILLSEAITDLESTENIFDIEGDLIYGGDTDDWIKAANSLRARYALYRKNYSNAMSYAAASFGTDENFKIDFGSANNEANPIYQYNTTSAWGADIVMASTFIDMLNAVNDPRLPFYADLRGGVYLGSTPGSEDDDVSDLGSYNDSPEAPVLFSSYAEMKFIEAECYMRQTVPDNDAAAAAYIAAVESSVDYVTGGADNEAWLDANIRTETGASITIEKIITQKYIAMYSTVVPYDDFRRTGYPNLTPVAGAGGIPVRFPYPQSEISYNNANVPSVGSLTDPLWIFDL
jgi:hypothetical protein